MVILYNHYNIHIIYTYILNNNEMNHSTNHIITINI